MTESATTPPITAERLRARTYLARNERGSEVVVGTGAEGFTPGELLRIAIAICNATSSEARLTHAFGADYPAHIEAVAVKNAGEERYESFEVTITVPLQDLDEPTRTKTLERATRAVEKFCTVGRTVEAGAGLSLRIGGEGE